MSRTAEQQHAQLERQLAELAGLRRELQSLYESTQDELHEARREAAARPTTLRVARPSAA